MALPWMHMHPWVALDTQGRLCWWGHRCNAKDAAMSGNVGCQAAVPVKLLPNGGKVICGLSLA